MAIPLDDLPKFNGWPARFLGPIEFAQRIKSEQEVLREYDVEKWGAMLREIEQERPVPAIETVEARAAASQGDLLCSVDDRLELLDPITARKLYVDMVADTISEYLPAPAIVELGCGYGSVLLTIARRFEGVGIIGGEFTQSGVELCRLLAEASGIPATVGHCDFKRSPVADFEIPAGSIVFTSYATTYISEFGPVLDRLRALKPAITIHFEPCFEHFDSTTLLGLLRQKYVIANDYNQDMISTLHSSQGAGHVVITRELRNVFGANPLLPASVVCWKPAG